MGNLERIARSAALLLGPLLAAAALAAQLPRLPPEIALPQGEGSPGAVTFRHDTHLDASRPSCVGCHPARFSILGRGRGSGSPAIGHAAMERGQACGGCHGKQAFGFESCEMCHKG